MRRAAAVFVLLIAATLPGCRHGPAQGVPPEVDPMLADIPRIVPDPSRAAAVTSACERLDRALREAARSRARAARASRALERALRSYDTPRESLVALVAGHARAARALRTEVLQAREDVRTHTTDGEWRALAKSRPHTPGGS